MLAQAPADQETQSAWSRFWALWAETKQRAADLLSLGQNVAALAARADDLAARAANVGATDLAQEAGAALADLESMQPEAAKVSRTASEWLPTFEGIEAEGRASGLGIFQFLVIGTILAAIGALTYLVYTGMPLLTRYQGLRERVLSDLEQRVITAEEAATLLDGGSLLSPGNLLGRLGSLVTWPLILVPAGIAALILLGMLGRR